MSSATQPKSLAPPPAGRSLRRMLLMGGAALTLAVGLERCFAFVSNLLAARWGGPQVFGSYGLVLATANTVAAYAGIGIGSTSLRFSGSYPAHHAGFRRFVHHLAVVSMFSAGVAALIMLVAAGPFARLMLHNASLTGLLRLAAISAGVLILADCCRGFLIGQQLYRGQVAFSLVLGTVMLVALPLAARVGPSAMVLAQAAAALAAIVTCVIVSARLLRRSSSLEEPTSGGAGPGFGDILRFGLLQLGVAVAMNFASWWLATLVARSDTSMQQMGFYAVGNQLRLVAVLLPGLFTQLIYPMLTEELGDEYGGPGRVLVVNSFLASGFVLLASCACTLVLPLALRLYGRGYFASEIACVVLVASAIPNMVASPASNRLNILRLRYVGVLNAIWAAVTIALSVALVPRYGAAGAGASWLSAFLLYHIGVLIALKMLGELPAGVTEIGAVSMAVSFSLAALGTWRALHPGGWPNLALAAMTLAVVLWLVSFARRQRWNVSLHSLRDAVLDVLRRRRIATEAVLTAEPQ